MRVMSKYQGVILAAGHGSRMGPFGERVPKPVAPICNRPLMAYQLDHLRSLGVEEVTVVIGHLGHVITQHLGDGREFGVRIRYVEQEKRLGLAHAVGQLERHIDRPFVLFLGDIFFEVDRLERLVTEFEQHAAAAVLAVMEEPDDAAIKKNFSVHLREDGTVRRVIEKPRHISNRLKGCGLYFFDLPIFDAIRRTPRTAMRDEYELTDAIQILIDYEYAVRVAPVVKWDMNLTFIGDLIACCVHELRQRGVTHIAGEGCTLGAGVTLEESVVGPGAVVAGSSRLVRCVVLPGARVETSGTYENTVFTGEGPLQAVPPPRL
jgi:NDP-sugar pyrophosphorylase family protein